MRSIGLAKLLCTQGYQNAAFAFAEGYQYPKNGKAPDSLLKLGMSLSRMGKRKEACTAFPGFFPIYEGERPPEGAHRSRAASGECR